MIQQAEPIHLQQNLLGTAKEIAEAVFRSRFEREVFPCGGQSLCTVESEDRPNTLVEDGPRLGVERPPLHESRGPRRTRFGSISSIGPGTATFGAKAAAGAAKSCDERHRMGSSEASDSRTTCSDCEFRWTS